MNNKALATVRETSVAKIKRRHAEDRQSPLPEQRVIADYLRGKIPRRRFVEIVGEKTFHALWASLAASIQEMTQKAQQQSVKASREDESANLAIMGIANSFLLWNLPDSYGVGPPGRERIVGSSVLIFPVVLTSPGYGIVGEVGSIAVDIQKQQVVGCTLLDTVQQCGRRCYEQHKEKIEAAFLQARRA